MGGVKSYRTKIVMVYHGSNFIIFLALCSYRTKIVMVYHETEEQTYKRWHKLSYKICYGLSLVKSRFVYSV